MFENVLRKKRKLMEPFRNLLVNKVTQGKRNKTRHILRITDDFQDIKSEASSSKNANIFRSDVK